MSEHVGTAQSVHWSSCLMFMWHRHSRSSWKQRDSKQNIAWGLRSQLSTNLSEIMRIKNAWDFTFFLLREHSVLNYSWQPQWPPHLALSGLNSITFRRGKNMPSLSPNHPGHMSQATLNSCFLCEEFKGTGTVQWQTPSGLEISQCILAKDNPLLLSLPLSPSSLLHEMNNKQKK